MNAPNSGNPDDPTQMNPPQGYLPNYGAPQLPHPDTNYPPQQGYRMPSDYGASPSSPTQTQYQPYGQPIEPTEIPNYGVPMQLPPRKRSRRGLWIGLAIGLLVIVLIAGFAVVSANRSTPAKTLATFCDAIKSKDYPTAYDQFSSHYKSRFSEIQFEAAWRVLSSGLFGGGITGCAPSNAQDNGSTGTATLTFTFSNGKTSSNIVHLINENGAWRIDDQLGR